MSNSAFESGKAYKNLCNTAFTNVIAQLLQGYICIGWSAGAQIGPYRKGLVDYELVWDLWNEQFAGFYFTHEAVSSELAIGAYGDVSLGFGFGRFSNVLDARSGEFSEVEYEASLSMWKVVNVSGAVQGFSKFDNSMFGGKVSLAASAGVPSTVEHLIKLPAHGSISYARGVWTPHDPLTKKLTSSQLSGALKTGGAPKKLFLDLQDGEVGTANHILNVLGTNALGMSLASYAFLVAAAKRHAEHLGITDRDAALKDLHLTLCNELYRLISRYRREAPSGMNELNFGSASVQRTRKNNYIVTSTKKDATGYWHTVRRLCTQDAAVLDGHSYWMATQRAPNGYIDGRSYSMRTFSDEIQRRRSALLER